MARDLVHPKKTRRSDYLYLFTSKHHGGGTSEDSRWANSITPDEEFAVFDNADWFVIEAESGWLYCVWKEDGELHDLGTWAQQIAEFPKPRANDPWHGYPIWAINEGAPNNRRGEKMRPTKQVFMKLQTAGLITKRQRKRLWKGDHT